MTIVTHNYTTTGARLVCEECGASVAHVEMRLEEPTGEGDPIVEGYALSPCGHNARFVMVPIETSRR